MKILLAAFAAGIAWGQAPDIGQIMARVAENQARSQELRKSWVYSQKQLLRMMRGSRKLAREERREYTIMPLERGSRKELTRFEGKYERSGKFIAYDAPGYKYKGNDIDGELIDDMSKDMTDDQQSRDGLASNLFPLTREQQASYHYRLAGIETHRGRQVYRVSFEPKSTPHEECDALWKGEALIDRDEYQPVLVTTKMALNIPAAVKVLLGTNIKGLGFSVSYRKFADGLWFPVSYGGEFDVRVLFLYRRLISVSMVNSDFRKADVTSNVAYAVEDQ
jgi:hypothetical protein